MFTALNFSKKNKFIKNSKYIKILNHFKKSSLPSNIKKFFSLKDLNKILSFMQKDKKNVSKKINLILLKDIGSPIINSNYNISLLKSFLRKELIN